MEKFFLTQSFLTSHLLLCLTITTVFFQVQQDSFVINFDHNFNKMKKGGGTQSNFAACEDPLSGEYNEMFHAEASQK